MRGHERGHHGILSSESWGFFKPAILLSPAKESENAKSSLTVYTSWEAMGYNYNDGSPTLTETVSSVLSHK